MNWLWSMSWPMLLTEIAAIVVAFISISLLAIQCYVNAMHLLKMRFDPEYRHKREAIGRHVDDIVEACDQIQAAYRDAAERNKEQPALRGVESCGEEPDDGGNQIPRIHRCSPRYRLVE